MFFFLVCSSLVNVKELSEFVVSLFLVVVLHELDTLNKECYCWSMTQVLFSWHFNSWCKSSMLHHFLLILIESTIIIKRHHPL